MQAQLLRAPSTTDSAPLALTQLETPEPQANEIRIKISTCGVCHTDLHIIKGEIHPPHLPLVPGHEIVGTVEARGAAATRFALGERVGVPWLNWIDPQCKWYGTDRENLCEHIRFTGFDTNGGYAEYICVNQDFCYAIPPQFTDEQAAPLLCAGVIGYRALRLSAIDRGERIGLFGFGASAHIVQQIAQYWGKRVSVFTRGAGHRQLARDQGAEWVGGSEETPPHLLDSAIIFAPVGDLVVRALALLERGGTVVHAGVHSTPIPAFDYELLYHERVVTSAANSTRRDVEELLALAAEIPVRAETTAFPLAEANRAVNAVAHSQVNGAAVLLCRD